MLPSSPAWAAQPPGGGEDRPNGQWRSEWTASIVREMIPARMNSAQMRSPVAVAADAAERSASFVVAGLGMALAGLALSFWPLAIAGVATVVFGHRRALIVA